MSQVFYYPPSSASSASTGTNGATAPTSSTEIGGIDPSGNLKGVAVDAAGNLLTSPSTLAPNASTASNQVLEIAQLTAISGKLPATLGQKTSANSLGIVIASDQSAIPVTGPLTDTQLRATAVPVSGPLTDTQLRATAVPISAAALPLPSGAATAANQTTANTSLSTVATNTANLSRLSGSLVPTAYDEVDLTYITVGNGIGQIGTAVYKLATATVKTVTLTYDASDRLSTVVAS